YNTDSHARSSDEGPSWVGNDQNISAAGAARGGDFMKRIAINASFALTCLLATAALAQQPRHMDLDDLGRIVRVSDPQIAPDGKSIVIVVGRANYDEDRYDSNLVLVDIAGAGQRVLTNERRAVSHPRFSPAGDRLAFLSDLGLGPGLQPHAQIFVM